MHATLITSAVISLFAAAAPTQEITKAQDEPRWAERASFFVGARGGVAVPPGALGLAANAGLEIGVAVQNGFGFSVRALWMDNPPGAPALGLSPAKFGFGALADFRYYFETIDPLVIYPTISVGFIAGPEKSTSLNAVLPLFNPGIGVKVKLGNVYGAFEFGVSGFTIPFVVFAVGFDGDSKATKRAAERALHPEPVAVAPQEVAPKLQAQPAAPRSEPGAPEDGWARP